MLTTALLQSFCIHNGCGAVQIGPRKAGGGSHCARRAVALAVGHCHDSCGTHGHVVMSTNVDSRIMHPSVYNEFGHGILSAVHSLMTDAAKVSDIPLARMSDD